MGWRLAGRRLLPHVLGATCHAQRLRAVPGRAVCLLTSAANDLREASQVDTAHRALDRALATAQAQLGPDHPDPPHHPAQVGLLAGQAGRGRRLDFW
jgi:hypothetical protein